jgi:toxin ParE1/3/4
MGSQCDVSIRRSGGFASPSRGARADSDYSKRRSQGSFARPSLLRRNTRNAGLVQGAGPRQPRCCRRKSKASRRGDCVPAHQESSPVVAKASNTFNVLFTEGAEQDLESTFDNICEFDSIQSAEYVLDEFLAVIDGLSKLPNRVSYPKELLALGIKEYRQAIFKAYRLIYRVIDDEVVIFLIADGRREMEALLSRRLLGN